MLEAGLRGPFCSSLLNAITGERLTDTIDLDQYRDRPAIIEQVTWFHRLLANNHKGILSLPSLELLTLVLSNTICSPETSAADCSSGDNTSLVRILLVSGLIQVVASLRPDALADGPVHNDVEFDLIEGNCIERIQPLIAFVWDCLGRSHKAQAAGATLQPPPIEKILTCFAAYLRIVAQLVYRSGVSGIIDSPDVFNSIGSSSLSTYIVALGLENILLDPVGQAGVLPFISKWVDPALDEIDGPVIRPPLRLMKLPRAYTEFHSDVKSLCSYDSPAICLLCGCILNGGGLGLVTEHCKTCSKDSGVFFLLQDATILLMHGDRACYFKSPYCDANGESQKTFRGKPLFNDAKRFEIIEGVWLGHEIPREVASKRSTLPQIVRLGYF